MKLGILIMLVFACVLMPIASFAHDSVDTEEEIEFTTIKLDKGRRFYVVSEQNINNKILEGEIVKFNAVTKEYLTYDKKPAKISFYGYVEKTSGPRLAGKSGTVKVKLEKIAVDKVSYPVEAVITKVDNKSTFGGMIAGAPMYLDNVADAANEGIIHNHLKDPCGDMTCSIETFKKPLVFLGASALQAADILIAPFVAIKKRGKDIEYPPNTFFEIKLEKELHVLDI